MRNKIKLIIPVILLFLLSGCVDIVLMSPWKNREIKIDGKMNDWDENQLVKEQNVAFGACNDAENLYLCLYISDKTTKAQLMGLFKQDFYIWFDTRGKNPGIFGLKFSNNSAFMDEDLLAKISRLKVQQFEVIGDEMMKNMEIQVIQNNYIVAPVSDAKGIETAINVTRNGRELVYELKIPLVKNAEHPYAIEAVKGKPIYFGLQDSPINMDALKKENSPEEPKNTDAPGQPGMDMRGRGRVHRNMAPGGTSTEEALENFKLVRIWCKIITADKP